MGGFQRAPGFSRHMVDYPLNTLIEMSHTETQCDFKTLALLLSFLNTYSIMQNSKTQ